MRSSHIKGLDSSHAPGYELILGTVVLSSVVIMAADFHFTGLASGSSNWIKRTERARDYDESLASQCMTSGSIHHDTSEL